MRLTKSWWILVFAMIGASGVVHGQDYQQMLDKMTFIQQQPAVKEAAIAAGHERAQLCGYCHGKDGNSVKDDIPNLASQNPEYLLKQFHLFATGERQSYVMEQVAKMLTPDEMINLALFFSNETVKPQANIKTSAAGQQKYQSFCFACHGEEGKGNRDLPRLAGQKHGFLLKALTDFKQGKTARANSPMVKIMRAVDAQDIAPLADYISSMQ